MSARLVNEADTSSTGRAEVLLNDLGVRAGRRQGAHRGVPQRVQVDAADTGALRQQLEAPEHVARLEWCTDLRGGDQAVVRPRACGRELFLPCRGLLGSQRLGGRTGEWNGPAGLVSLGLVELQPLDVREGSSPLAR